MSAIRIENRFTQNLIAVFLLTIGFYLNFTATINKTVTYDEPAHYRYGLNVLKGDTSRFDDSKMPVSALNALPLHLGKKLPPGKLRDRLTDFLTARTVTMVFSALLGWIVFAWSRALFGAAAGLFSLFLYVFDPNVQGHAVWVTNDLYAAFFITASCYAFWKFLKHGGIRHMFFAAFLLGLAQLSKFSAVYLYLFLPLAAMGYKGKAFFSPKTVAAILFFIGISLAVVNIGYLGNGSGTPLRDYDFKSQTFEKIQQRAGALSEIPLPLPKPFIEGLDWVKHNEVSGEGRGPAYLLGRTSAEGFPFYYLICLVYKMPLALWIILAWAIGTFFSKRRKDIAFVLLPAIYYFCYFEFAGKAQMGIRMMLMIFPFIHVFCGMLFDQISAPTRRATVAAAVLCVWLSISFASYHPHQLSYFNELAGDRKKTYKILADSNLDWGQNEITAVNYAYRHPQVRKNPKEPVPGKVLISANLLTGIIYPGQYRWYGWILQNLEPTGHVGYSYLLFDIPADAKPQIDAWLASQP